VKVPYERINLLEYGQKVDRRYIAAVVISPLFMLAKKREHFLTIGFQDDDGQQQAMVFRVDKNDIRLTLVALEARTGQQVQYQDEEARIAGKG
jgi:6-phosphogluconolactonase (cycloisomerase 2 family)